MQQILDRTQESLAQAFASLARNARRQQHLYYTTIGLLIAIVVVSAVLLAVLAAAREIDYRRGHVAQYVSAISLQLQGEATFLRRTALTVVNVQRYRPAPNPAHADADLPRALLQQVHASGIASPPDGRYTLLIPPETRAAWGAALPDRLWQLQQVANAALTTQQALDLHHPAYIVDADAAYAIVLSPGSTSATALALQPGLVTTLRDSFAEALRALPAGPAPGTRGEPRWIGPTVDPMLQLPAMTALMSVSDGERPVAFVAASVPVGAFLAQLQRPSDPATLMLVNHAQAQIDVSPPSPPAPPAVVRRILTDARDRSSDAFAFTRAGMVLIQPLGHGFGALVYLLSYGLLFSAVAQALGLIGLIGALLIAAIVVTARYWDDHLLRRSHAEAARALESETINHILVSATPIGLCIVRLQDDVVLTSNQVADSLLSLNKGGRLPAHVVQALRHGARRDTPGDIVSVAQVVVPAREPDDAPKPHDEAQQFLQITHARARYQEEDVLFCAIQDVTAQQQIEHELRAAQQTSEAMMRARSNFFASMSHEIRTPLNALLGNLELLARDEGLEAHAPRLRALNAASEGLRRIVNDILDFSKIDAGEMTLAAAPFRPIDELESVALAFAPLAADRPIRFHANLMPSLDTVLVGDRTRLAQIANNLLSNAFKFTSCGKITLAAEVSTDPRGRTTLVCRVLDSGVGMPPELVARVFQPFVQGDAGATSRHGGTGLGLSICARLCELMDGRIAVESVEGVGTAFTVAIPLERAAGWAAQPPPAPGGRAMVLCQEAESGEAIDAWLQSAGWQTHVAYTLGGALAYLRGNRPHVLVATGDYGLPELAALREIRPAGVAWLTRNGPDRPARRAPGVHEAMVYSHSAIFAAIEAALGDSGEDEGDADNAEDEASAALANDDNPAPGRTILVVEDNALNQTLVAEQLQTLGWHPVVVGDGRQALAMLEQMSAEPDLVLTDIHMPVMDGYALLESLRRTRPALPVLAFSAVTQTGQAVDWDTLGFAGHIGKPASLREMEQVLRTFAMPLPSAPAAPPARPVLPPADISRYQSLLREHLQTDLPDLTRIIAAHDPAGLRHWAHRSAGAFQIVQAHDIVGVCRNVEHLCEAAATWTPEVAGLADQLHTVVQHYAEGDTAPQV